MENICCSLETLSSKEKTIYDDHHEVPNRSTKWYSLVFSTF